MLVVGDAIDDGMLIAFALSEFRHIGFCKRDHLDPFARPFEVYNCEFGQSF